MNTQTNDMPKSYRPTQAPRAKKHNLPIPAPLRPDMSSGQQLVCVEQLLPRVAKLVAQDRRLSKIAKRYAHSINAMAVDMTRSERRRMATEFHAGFFIAPDDPTTLIIYKILNKHSWVQMARVWHWMLESLYPDHEAIRHILTKLKRSIQGAGLKPLRVSQTGRVPYHVEKKVVSNQEDTSEDVTSASGTHCVAEAESVGQEDTLGASSLDEPQKSIPEFDFRVLEDEFGTREAMVWLALYKFTYGL